MITQSNTYQGSDLFITELIAATADTTVTIAHGLGAIANAAGAALAGAAPQIYTLTPIHADAYLSEWVVASINTTNIILNKRSQSLSGGAAPQVRLVVNRPHSVGR